MRLINVFILTIVLSFDLMAQNDVYQFEFNQISPVEVIHEIENKTGLKFYYAPEWLDSLQVQAITFQGTLDEILMEIFSQSKINHLILDDKIILTYNAPILTEITYDTISISVPESKYIFAREYEDEVSGDNEEDQTFVVGNKSRMQIGGSSLLSGFIKNESNDEVLVGAFIKSDEATAISDDRGFYVIKVPNGKSVIHFQFGGMKSERRKILVFSDGRLNVNMIPNIVMLDNLTIKANADENISSVQMGVYKFAVNDLKNVPKFFGENDILKVALTLPGVQNVGEGSSGINVRGGNADQNLILLNNATIYNPFHFFGFFSSFNADILESTELYKSSIPVNFGGRLSSVLDVKARGGNKEKISGKGGLGIVTSSLNLEVPLLKNKTSMTVGGRSTYSDWVLRQVDNETIKNSSPLFYDLSAGIDHVYGQANNINVSGYYSYDQFKLSTDSLYAYSNFSLSLNWRHHISKRLSSEFVATTSQYDYNIDYSTSQESAFNFGFKIGDVFSQLKFDYTPSVSHTLQAGVDVRLYDINPGFRRPKNELSTVPFEKIADERGIETAFFVADNFVINEKWSVYGGVRYSGFAALGPGTWVSYQPGAPKSTDNIIDSVTFKSNEIVKSYFGPEFRSSIRYSIDKTRSVKASYNATRQYLHNLSNTVSISPTDTWKLSDRNVLPLIANQYSLGYFENFKENTLEASVEIYYKSAKNLIDYKTNADLVLNQSLETDILQGDGRSYGVELFLRKGSGKLNGWVSYTYSRSLQRYRSRFDEETINDGEFFPTNYDKPHVVNLVGNYKLTRRYSFALNINYASGRPVTYPTASYKIGGAPIIHFAERNRFRIPDYFRIDIGVNVEGTHKIKKPAHGFWSFNIYNVLSRDNAYSIFFRSNEGNIKGYQLSVLGAAIPSITYKFEF